MSLKLNCAKPIIFFVNTNYRLMHSCNWQFLARLALIRVLRTRHQPVTDMEMVENSYAKNLSHWAKQAERFEREHIDQMTTRHNSKLYSIVYMLCMCVPWLSHKLQPIFDRFIMPAEQINEKVPFRALCELIDVELFGGTTTSQVCTLSIYPCTTLKRICNPMVFWSYFTLEVPKKV